MIRAELLGLLTTTATKVAVVVAIAGLIVTQLVFVSLLPAMLAGAFGPEAAEASSDRACRRRTRLVGAKAAATAIAAIVAGIAMTAIGALTPIGTVAIAGIPRDRLQAVLWGIRAGVVEPSRRCTMAPMLREVPMSRFCAADPGAAGSARTDTTAGISEILATTRSGARNVSRRHLLVCVTEMTYGNILGKDQITPILRTLCSEPH